MKKYNFIILQILILTVAVVASTPEDRGASKLERIIQYKGEKILYVNFKLSSGFVNIEKGDSDQLFNGVFLFEKEPPEIDYEKIGNEGQLTMRLRNKYRKSKNEDQSQRISSLDELFDNECYLKFTPKIPIEFSMEMGVFKGTLDFSGLKVRSLSLEAGVGKGKVEFNEPNPILMKELTIEAGVGKLVVAGLGNANFEDFSFDGGLGTYSLYFDGDLRESANVEINVGLGKLKLYLPREIGVRLKVNKTFLSSFSIDEVYKKRDYYYNENWGKGGPSLDIQIDSGLGKIDIVWLEDE